MINTDHDDYGGMRMNEQREEKVLLNATVCLYGALLPCARVGGRTGDHD